MLQDRFYEAHHIQWWELLTGVTYMTHFFLVYMTAAVLFLKRRDSFVRWMTALVVLTVFGVLGYWLFPMAPPGWPPTTCTSSPSSPGRAPGA